MYQNYHDTINAAPKRPLRAIVAVCAIAALLGWSALPGPAMAGDGADGAFTRSVRITVHRGDLDNPIAAKRLFGRIEEAALEVCGASRFSFPDVRRAVRRSDCWRQSVSTAVAELHDPGLTTFLAQRIEMDGAQATRQD